MARYQIDIYQKYCSCSMSLCSSSSRCLIASARRTLAPPFADKLIVLAFRVLTVLVEARSEADALLCDELPPSTLLEKRSIELLAFECAD